MNLTEFERQHNSKWRKLESTVRSRRLKFKSREQLNEFADLYRSVASDLSYAQTRFPGQPIVHYLNTLVTLAHNRFYRSSEGGFRSIGTFYATGFPTLFRKSLAYILLSALLVMAGGVFGYYEVLNSPVQAYALLPPSFLSQFDPAHVGPHSVDAPFLSSYIMTHNIFVCLLSFVGGITFGLYTMYTLWQNGLIIGILAALMQNAGKSTVFWSLIVPHGVTELLAIFISGGAGLVFAHRLVFPGHWKRSTAIRLGLMDAVGLILGIVPMLMIAGTLEGFLTPSFLPTWSKFAVAVITGAWWTLYFGFFGRSKAQGSGSTSAQVLVAPS